MVTFPFPRYRNPPPPTKKPAVATQAMQVLQIGWSAPHRQRLTWMKMEPAGRFTVGRKSRCTMTIATFPWDHFVLFMQDGLNTHGIEVHLLQGMRARIRLPETSLSLGPEDYSPASFSDFSGYWTWRLPQRCIGSIDVFGTLISFRSGNRMGKVPGFEDESP